MSAVGLRRASQIRTRQSRGRDGDKASNPDPRPKITGEHAERFRGIVAAAPPTGDTAIEGMQFRETAAMLAGTAAEQATAPS
jgi:hypothetical protein